MPHAVHTLVQQLAGKNNLEECSVEELRGITQRHPYFAPAQFLLLHKLRHAGLAEEADAQYKKAVLFYPDPLQFDVFISSGSFFVDEAEATPVSDGMPLAPNGGEVDAPASLDVKDEAPIPDPLVREAATAFAEQLPAPQPRQDVTPTEDMQFGPTTSVVEEEEADSRIEPPEATVPQSGGMSNSLERQGEPAPQSNEMEDAKPVAADLAFEPFHTVDYFASQGIKITQEEAPKDKLGKGLKSFTEWLRTMKRLPSADASAAPASAAERNVESMASHSVSQNEVVTEAMAEVWARQGNREKALDIYNKLSLQNPSRTAYFAGKIQNLNHS